MAYPNDQSMNAGAIPVRTLTSSGGSDGQPTTALAAGTPVNTAGFGSIIVEVTNISGATIVMKGGIAASNTMVGRNMADTTAALISSITVNGLYLFPALGNVSYTISGGTAIVNTMLKS